MVDVFGSKPLLGNQLAVVIDSDGLTTTQMLELTRWVNFSETTFLLPPTSPDADYGVRIFTLAGELPFAGHPTLGTCHVWRSMNPGSSEEVVQECGAGLVPVRSSGDLLAFRAPPQIRDGAVDPDQLERFAAVLGVESSEIVASRWVDNGPGWVGILLADADRVQSLRPDPARFGSADKLDIGVAGFNSANSEALYEVRAFFSNQHGELLEDPVTGSLNASMAQWLIDSGRAHPPYVASQGGALGRSGAVHISTTDDGAVWVGGRVFDVVEGQLADGII
jgi:PhzF family phenazine biosynthesis protein